MYARYRTRSRFYKRPEKVLKAYNVSPNLLRRPMVKKGLLSGLHTDETVDLRHRERLELLEAIRHPRERDFYQDHTYHNQWVSRELERHQKLQLSSRYRFFAPGYEIEPWIWYPGDLVEVVSGEAAGQRGVILAVVKYKNEVVVQNVNVRDVVIPASEGRPEQVLQREHPIRATRVRHVDPSTDAICEVAAVQVRNRRTGALEASRISLGSGLVLPIPAREEAAGLHVGDPLKDTAMLDAEETTYDAAREAGVLVERRLRAIEDHFVRTLREAHDFHAPLRARNGEAMRAFQDAVLAHAAQRLAERFHAGEDTKTAPWWRDMVAPYVEEEEEAARAAEAEAERQRQEAEVETDRANPGPDSDDDEPLQDEEDDDDDDDDDEEEKYENSDADGDENEDNDRDGDDRVS